jgi:hypothetical protein
MGSGFVSFETARGGPFFFLLWPLKPHKHTYTMLHAYTGVSRGLKASNGMHWQLCFFVGIRAVKMTR